MTVSRLVIVFYTNSRQPWGGCSLEEGVLEFGQYIL